MSDKHDTIISSETGCACAECSVARGLAHLMLAKQRAEVERDNAQAAVKELARQVAEITAMHEQACRERDALRAEVERLTRERDKALAEFRVSTAGHEASNAALDEALGEVHELKAEVEKLRRVAEDVKPLLAAVVRLVREWPFPSTLVRGMAEDDARRFAGHGHAITDGYGKVCDALAALDPTRCEGCAAARTAGCPQCMGQVAK